MSVTAELPKTEDKAAKARLTKRINDLLPGDGRVVFWRAGNMGEPNPLPVQVVKVFGGGIIQCVAFALDNTISCEGARHWKDPNYEANPKTKLTTPSWAFNNEEGVTFTQ